jgi:hypothetical protein
METFVLIGNNFVNLIRSAIAVPKLLDAARTTPIRKGSSTSYLAVNTVRAYLKVF